MIKVDHYIFRCALTIAASLALMMCVTGEWPKARGVGVTVLFAILFHGIVEFKR